MASDAPTDSAFALRSFRRSPGWTFVPLLTIALGVGASTAVFSVADAFLVRPLAYGDASRVYAVSLQGTLQGHPLPLPSVSRGSASASACTSSGTPVRTISNESNTASMSAVFAPNWRYTVVRATPARRATAPMVNASQR